MSLSEFASAAPRGSTRPVAALLVLFFLILASDTDMFLDDVLQPLGGTLRANGTPNAKGAVARALIIVVAFAVLTALLNGGVI